jgi:hypothetical protein
MAWRGCQKNSSPKIRIIVIIGNILRIAFPSGEQNEQKRLPAPLLVEKKTPRALQACGAYFHSTRISSR